MFDHGPLAYFHDTSRDMAAPSGGETCPSNALAVPWQCARVRCPNLTRVKGGTLETRRSKKPDAHVPSGKARRTGGYSIQLRWSDSATCDHLRGEKD